MMHIENNMGDNVVETFTGSLMMRKREENLFGSSDEGNGGNEYNNSCKIQQL